MRRTFVVVLVCLCLVACASLVSAWEDPDVTECKKHDNDCGACLANPKCGYCGLFEYGFCIPQLYKAYCTNEDAQWKTDECVFQLREVGWNKTDTKIEWKLIEITGTNSSDAVVEGVIFSLGVENSEDVVLAIGHAKGNTEDLDFSFHAIAYDNFIEFADKNGDGKWDHYTEPPTRIYNISSPGFLPIQYQNTTISNDTVLHQGIVETMDGTFKLVCHVSNNKYSLHDGAKSYSPYEMKCDIELTNYERQVATDLLAINTFIVSAQASFNVSASNTTVKKCRMGNGAAFFDWEDYIEIDGGNETAPVKVSDLELKGLHFPWSDSPVYTTIFSFVTTSGSWIWDPLVGIDTSMPPPPPPDDGSSSNAHSDANSNTGDEVSAGSGLFACIKTVALILTLAVSLFHLL